MKNIFSILLTLLLVNIASAQYTEIINSRLPGYSDSPFSVGTDVFQLENSFFYKDNNNEGDIIQSFGSSAIVRYGKFFERLEGNVMLDYQYDNIDYENPDKGTIKGFVFTKFVVGGKYMVYKPEYLDRSKEIRSWKKKNRFDWRRLIPSVGVFLGANVPITKNYVGGWPDKYIKDKISPRAAIYTHHEINPRLNILMNFIADKHFTPNWENTYIITATYTLYPKFSIFGEHQGIFKSNVPNDYQFGGGLAYLFSKDIQIGISGRFITERDGFSKSANIGFSWRLDKHQDAFKLIGSDGNVAESEEKEGFFKKVFGIFKKKDKERKVKKVKAKKRKIKKDKPKKKTKAQKRREKESKKREKEQEKLKKEEKKQKKRDAKAYSRNYEPPSEDDE